MNHERTPLTTSSGDEIAATSKPTLRPSLNPFQVQRGTFVTLRSPSECEEILLKRIRPEVIRGSRYDLLDRVVRQQSAYEGYATSESFSLRRLKIRSRDWAPTLHGIIREDPDGTTIRAELYGPNKGEFAKWMAKPSVIMIATMTVRPDPSGILLGGLISGLLILGVMIPLLRTLRRGWNDYVSLLESSLSAQLVVQD